MAKVTSQILQTLGVRKVEADKFFDPINAACALSDLSSAPRLAAFLGQVLVESDSLRYLEENLYYRPARIMQIFPRIAPTLDMATALAGNPQALASLAYGNRNGNGAPVTGDGYKYRGRGLIGLTFKSNYAAAQSGTGRPYLDNPDLLLQPSDACLSAAWFWNSRNCSKLADIGDEASIDAVTRLVNGPGMLKKEERKALRNKAFDLLKDQA
jgi:putative chitinase